MVRSCQMNRTEDHGCAGCAFLIGTARREIPVPSGVRLQGHLNRSGPSNGCLDPLHIRVLLVMRNGFTGDETIDFALIHAEILSFDEPTNRRIKNKLSREFAIAPQRIVLAATHTHTAPPVIRLGSLHPDESFVRSVETAVSTAFRAALRTLDFAYLESGSRRTNRWAVNRRLWDKHGIVMAPNPHGPVDPEISVGIFSRCSDGEAIATLVNVAMHPTILGVELHVTSGDYPGRIARYLETHPNHGGVTMVLVGAAGDVKPVLDLHSASFREGDERDINRIGEDIGSAVLQIARSATRSYDSTIRFEHRIIQLRFAEEVPENVFRRFLLDVQSSGAKREPGVPTDSPNPADNWQRKHFDQDRLSWELTEWAKRWIARCQDGSAPPPPQAEIQFVQLGKSVRWIFLPGEPFAQLGVDIRRILCVPTCMVAAYCNATIGYLPTRAAADEPGYETSEAYRFYDLPSRLHPETADDLVALVQELVDEVDREDA
jgi:neutral ceramidase